MRYGGRGRYWRHEKHGRQGWLGQQFLDIRSSQKWVKSLEIVFKKFLNWAIWADKADWADMDRDQTFKKDLKS